MVRIVHALMIYVLDYSFFLNDNLTRRAVFYNLSFLHNLLLNSVVFISVVCFCMSVLELIKE